MSDGSLSPTPVCPRCVQLEQRIAQLEALVRDLRERLDRNSSSSSIPPSANPLNAPKPVVKNPSGRKPAPKTRAPTPAAATSIVARSRSRSALTSSGQGWPRFETELSPAGAFRMASKKGAKSSDQRSRDTMGKRVFRPWTRDATMLGSTLHQSVSSLTSEMNPEFRASPQAKATSAESDSAPT